MTALNKQALNPAELESALLELKRISEQPAVSTHYARVLRKHIANLNCALGAAEKRIAELEAREQKNLAEERQRVIDGLCTIGETAWEIDEYMKEWDAKHLRKAASAGIGVKGE